MSIEQQPEAWIVINKETGFRTQVASIAPFMYEKKRFELIPLYTHPKREPLSEKEIEDYINSLRSSAVSEEYYSEEWEEGFEDGVKWAEKQMENKQ